MSLLYDLERAWDALSNASRKLDDAQTTYNRAHADWIKDESASNTSRKDRARNALVGAAQEQSKAYHQFKRLLEQTGIANGGRDALRRLLDSVCSDAAPGWYRAASSALDSTPKKE
ncbi:MAG TPA: hypothetical protein VFB38_07105 [Chthonomonadaceae bacterium]|nr:hypothetical protein [Chthonomonadaceae bacterium]